MSERGQAEKSSIAADATERADMESARTDSGLRPMGLAALRSGFERFLDKLRRAAEMTIGARMTIAVTMTEKLRSWPRSQAGRSVPAISPL